MKMQHQTDPFAAGAKRTNMAVLAPLLHWRVCHVWEWLKHWACETEYGDWSTKMIADAYGGDEAEEINARIRRIYSDGTIQEAMFV